ncbi:peptidoglycan-binding protein [Streptomyces atroolivaceus]|uniref:peptidoglycan-binding protein n=1 Tax=Streptomyces atroolivaceus TaxID=66869 RepID=UPI00363B34C8
MTVTRSVGDDVGEEPSRDDGPAVSGTVLSRRRWVVTAAAGAVLLAGAGVGASTLIKSPAQAAADAAAPEPDVLSAVVDERVLKDSVILRGTVTAGQSVEVTPVLAETGDSGTRTVVTKLPVGAGDRVSEGQVVLEVSGRPVFVMKGTLPVYRDLKPGSVGNDVRQLQKALASLGHHTGRDAPGTFGAGTKTALSAFYRDIGYDALPASPDEEDKIGAAREAETTARRAYQDARKALESTSGPSRTAAASDGAVDGKGGTDPETILARAAEDLQKAEDLLAEAEAAAGPMLPSGEVVFLRGFPAHVAKVSSAIGSPADGAALTLAAGELVVHGYVQETQKGLIRAGHPVEILSELSGVVVKGEVRTVADSLSLSAGTDPASAGGEEGTASGAVPATPDGYLIVVKPGEALSSKVLGEDMRLTIETGSTEGKALVVPVTAVSSGADGRSTVTVLEESGKQRRVAVRAGTSADGFLAVNPADDGALAAGDRVITGVKGTTGMQR